MSMLTVCDISKDAVIDQNFSLIDSAISVLEGLKSSGRQQLVIWFNGYHDDPREVHEIPEIRTYVTKIFEKHPHLFYFLSHFDDNANMIFFCLSDNIETQKPLPNLSLTEWEKLGVQRDKLPKIQMGFKLDSELAKKIVLGIAAYAEKISESVENFKGIIAALPFAEALALT